MIKKKISNNFIDIFVVGELYLYTKSLNYKFNITLPLFLLFFYFLTTDLV